MKRLSALAVLVTMTFVLAACGGGQASQDSGSDQEQPEPTTQETAEATGETTQTPGTTQASDEPEPTAAQTEQEAQEEQADSGYSVTTMDGSKVSIGGGGATALFFMAGY
jgi:phage repressor protein C with HTH and peptisase S24 domain